jgi:hypothetical protein
MPETLRELTPFQPILRPEQPPGKAERFFIAAQPHIFPPNQDSNWGLKRKTFTDQVQVLIDQQDLLWQETFVQFSEQFLDEWEFMAGVPESTSGLTIEERRLRVLSRLRTGPFTDLRRIDIIEPYILATFGVSVELTPLGVSLFGGIPLLSDASGNPKQFYRIYEDVRNFTYTVYISSTLTPNIVSLTRDLKRITPAGITIVIDNSQAAILNYEKETLNGQPAGYWRLGNTSGADSSGNGFTGTWNGSPVTVASPGLLHASVLSPDGAITLDGTDDYMIVSGNPRLHTPRISLEAWYRPNALPASGSIDVIVAESGDDFIGIDGTTGNFIAAVMVGGTRRTVQGAPAVIGTTYHLVSRFTGAEIQLYVNGVLYRAAAGGVRDIGNTSFYIGRAQGGGSFATGVVDEVALFDRTVTEEEILMRYNTGRNVAV